MANKELSIILKAVGATAAAAQIAKVDKSVRNLGGNLKAAGGSIKGSILSGVGLGLGVSAWGLLDEAVSGGVRALTDSVKAAAEEEVGIARLTAALKANVAGWDGNSAAIERTIEARQAFAFSDDDLRASLAILVGATKDVGKAFDIQSVAMDLARYKGISLEEASAALIKVENGQYRLLKALGIELPKNATAVQALAAVEAQAAGQAEAYSKTSQGAFDQLGIAVENLQEDVGRGLTPAMEDLALGIQVYGIPTIRGLMEGLGGLGDVARTILGPLGLIPDAIGGIADAARFAASPLASLNDLLGGLNQKPAPKSDTGTTFTGRGGGARTGGATGGATATIPTNPGIRIRPTASGGIVTSPQVRLVGEAGPEAIIPLGRMPQPRIVVNVTVPTPRDYSRGVVKVRSWGGASRLQVAG